MSDNENIKYAATYWEHYHKEVMFGPTLKELVFSIEAMTDAGDCASGKYWAIVGESWEEVDALDEKEEYTKFCDEQYDKWVASTKKKPWSIRVSGPDDTYDHIGQYLTREEALEAADTLSSVLKAEVVFLN